MVQELLQRERKKEGEEEEKTDKKKIDLEIKEKKEEGD